MPILNPSSLVPSKQDVTVPIALEGYRTCPVFTCWHKSIPDHPYRPGGQQNVSRLASISPVITGRNGPCQALTNRPGGQLAWLRLNVPDPNVPTRIALEGTLHALSMPRLIGLDWSLQANTYRPGGQQHSSRRVSPCRDDTGQDATGFNRQNHPGGYITCLDLPIHIWTIQAKTPWRASSHHLSIRHLPTPRVTTQAKSPWRAA